MSTRETIANYVGVNESRLHDFEIKKKSEYSQMYFY